MILVSASNVLGTSTCRMTYRTQRTKIGSHSTTGTVSICSALGLFAVVTPPPQFKQKPITSIHIVCGHHRCPHVNRPHTHCVQVIKEATQRLLCPALCRDSAWERCRPMAVIHPYSRGQLPGSCIGACVKHVLHLTFQPAPLRNCVNSTGWVTLFAL
eukprot:SAG31_NODE_332_length_17516_cov_3.552840_10_plen_157_part_00